MTTPALAADHASFENAYNAPSVEGKVFTNSDAEFRWPTRGDVVGFLLAWVALGGIIGLLSWLPELGRKLNSSVDLLHPS